MHSVLLDTSFFIRLLNDADPLHTNALNYYQNFLNQETKLICSTIAVSEYCVRGTIDELPLMNLLILPFNIDHAKRAGELARFVFEQKGRLSLSNRAIIPNDTKLFAQADTEQNIHGYVTFDEECISVYNLLNNTFQLNFKFINARNKYAEEFGMLDL